MPELMHGDAQARRLLDALGDLTAQGGQALVASAHTGKKVWFVRTAEQDVQMIVYVVLYQLRQFVAENGFQPHAVLHIIPREHEPIGGSWPARSNEVLADPYGAEVPKTGGE